LIFLNFNLDKWLDGTMIGTIYSQSFEDWVNGEKSKDFRKQSLSFKPCIKSVYDQLTRFLKLRNNNRNNNKKKAAEILDTFFEENIGLKNKLETHLRNIEERIQADSLTKENLATYLFTQNPSPARLYRVWRETEEFFDLIIREVKDKIYSNKWKRIKFCVDYIDWKSKLKQGKKIENKILILQINNLEPQNLLVFHNKNGEFYTIESLEKFKFNNKTGEEAVKEALKQGFEHLALEDDPSKNLLKDSQKVEPDENNIKTEDYYPLIKINKSPLSLRLIVAAQDAIKILELITELYNEKFKRVIGKLPLNVGLIVSKRKFPLYVLLDTTRRILEVENFKESEMMDIWWNITHIRDDKYYGFYPVEQKDKKYILDELAPVSKGRLFALYPGYFDFEMLFATTDRYKVIYDKSKKRTDEDYKLFTARPYCFYQISQMTNLWEVLLNNLSNSQINFIEEILTEKLREWKNIRDRNKQCVFRKFAEATLKGAFAGKWNKLRKETRDFLLNSAINGFLLDTIILFRHTIKAKKIDENE